MTEFQAEVQELLPEQASRNQRETPKQKGKRQLAKAIYETSLKRETVIFLDLFD